MENRVKNFLLENNLIINSPIVCAVSGGADSVSMLHILHRLGYKVILAHVNHNKRSQSIIEEESMRKLAMSLSIPFELLDYHYSGEDNFHNDSHNARYDFFRCVCEKYNTNILATAHHSDDQIETVLMKIIEGSNLYGYGGISVCNDDGRYKIIRPLLCVNKKEIYEYASKNKLTFFEDSSNNEDIFLRNRIRHHIVPKLRVESSDINNKIMEYSIQLKEAFSFIRKQSIDYLSKTNNKIVIDSFNELDIALKKDIISLMFEKLNISKTYDIINSCLSILDNAFGTKSVTIADNYLFIRNYNTAQIKKIDDKIFKEVKLYSIQDEVYFDKYKFYFSKNIPLNAFKYIKLCYNTIELPFVVRSKKDGDEINLPFGTKKISRIFIDKKINKNLRDSIPVIEDGKHNILWVMDLIKSNDVLKQKESGDIYFVCEEVFYA